MFTHLYPIIIIIIIIIIKTHQNPLKPLNSIKTYENQLLRFFFSWNSQFLSLQPFNSLSGLRMAPRHRQGTQHHRETVDAEGDPAEAPILNMGKDGW